MLKAWGLPRSTFYQRRRLHASPGQPVRRGPKTHCNDEQLAGEIRRTIQTSPFHGEGHRKVWARLRLAGVCTSLRRVLRLMRQHQLLAHQRQPQPVEPKRHEGTIVAERPNQMRGIDATAGFTLRDGQVPIFAMIDHCSACCLGIHVAKRGTRFEALEPVRQAVREQFGGFSEGIAVGVKLRHDHGSQFMSDDSWREIRFLDLESSPAFVRELKATARSNASSALSRNSFSGCGTSTSWRSWPKRSKNSASATTSSGWSNGFTSNPHGRLTRPCLPSKLPHDGNSKNCPRDRVRYIHFRLPLRRARPSE